VATRIVRKDKPVARLVVFAPPHRVLGGAKLADSTVVSYVAIDKTGEMRAGSGPIALAPRTSRLEIAFDAGDVFHSQVAVPKLSDAKLRLALPNLLEERLLADATDGHYAFRHEPGVAAGSLPVAVIDRGLLTRLLDVFNAIGERARAAYSAIYVLPPPADGVLSVRVDRGHGIARTSAHDGFAFDYGADTTPATLLLALKAGKYRAIRCHGPDSATLVRAADALGVPVEEAGTPIDPQAPTQAINLLQGSFASRSLVGDVNLPALSWRSLKAPTLWMTAAAAVFVLGMNSYWLKLKGESGELERRMKTAFASAFPGAEMVDAIRQTQQQLQSLRARAGQSSATDFTALNAQVTQLLAASPVGIVAAIEYRDLALKLRFKSPPDPVLQNELRRIAIQQGLLLSFEADGAARVTAAGG
jgi:general secretion pathway protein L